MINLTPYNLKNHVTLFRKINNYSLFYVTAFILISFIPSWQVYNLLFHPSLLPGSDPANHALYILRIIRLKSVLIPSSQFLINDYSFGYYPPFLHIFFSGLHLLTQTSIIDLMRFFMFFIFLFGEVNYMFLSKKLANKNSIRGLLIYSILAFNTAPIIKTLRDGCYGEIFAMWFLFPLFISSLLSRRSLWSILIFVVIVWSNNLSTIMVGALLLSFILSHMINREWQNLRFILKVIIAVIILAAPALYYFYLPKIINTLQFGEGSQRILAFSEYSIHLTELTLYTGLISLLVTMLLYRRFRWLPLWFGLYILLANLSFSSSRVVREMTVPLSLSIGVFLCNFVKTFMNKIAINATSIKRSIEDFLLKSKKVQIGLLALLVIIFANNGIALIASEAEPVILDYGTSLKVDAYQWLHNKSMANGKGVIIIKNLDPWAKVYVNSKVYEIYPPSISEWLSLTDRSINNELAYSLLNPFNSNAIEMFCKYDISYIILSTPLQGRWYPDGVINFANTLLNIKYESTPLCELIYYQATHDEMIKIYEIHR